MQFNNIECSEDFFNVREEETKQIIKEVFAIDNITDKYFLFIDCNIYTNI